MAKRPEREIASVASEVLELHEIRGIPVDPFKIVEAEEIELVQVTSGRPGFDGRIRYLSEVNTYSLAYQVSGPGRPEGRVRFTVAHELGHFYLHRGYLRSGRSHGSKADFRSNDEMEQEADEFAAALLMPMGRFRKAVADFRQSVCDLGEICELANRLGTSVTSTVRRYCLGDIEATGVIFSRDGIAQWAWWSDDMRRLGLGFFPSGRALPRDSVSVRSAAKLALDNRIDGEVVPETWFENPRCPCNLWEEAMLLGGTGLMLTYLTLTDNPWPDSDD